jgi:3'-phosphoadenosine 5'-phosphosulfate sulfotransferase (PAPS reductase)/FAD synthetase
MTKHVVQYSGGISSWGAAVRVAERYGSDDLDLLFADTLIEHPDTYAFLEASAADVGGNLIRITEGRTPWQVFKDKRFLGNARIDPCSEMLKRKPLRSHIEANYSPDDTVLYFGMDWTELHRLERARPRWEPWKVEAPLAEWAPLHDKDHWIEKADSLGLPSQALYEAGMPHANCGGGCVKAGQGHFAKLWEEFPDVFAEWEANEQDVREHLDKDVAILRSRIGGTSTPLTLSSLRERLEAKRTADLDLADFGGCGCALE